MVERIIQIAFYLLVFIGCSSLTAREKLIVQFKECGIYCFTNSFEDDANFDFECSRNVFDIAATKTDIIRGRIKINSQKAGYHSLEEKVDYNLVIEVDAIRTDANHPDHIWIHGFATGTISYGTAPAFDDQAGQTISVEGADGELIAVINRWGSSRFRARIEVEHLQNPPEMPDFLTASFDDLIAYTDMYKMILVKKDKKRSRRSLKTSGETLLIQKRGDS